MPIASAFYSINEGSKPMPVHHNNSACAPGRDIPQWERRAGTGNYPAVPGLCPRHELRKVAPGLRIPREPSSTGFLDVQPYCLHP